MQPTARTFPASPRAALIDMDGTLYDSMPGHARAWHRLAMELGIPASEQEFFEHEGRTGAAIINILFQRAYGHDATQEQARELYARKARYFVEQGEPRPMPGAREMLEAFRDAGVQTVLVTGSGQNSLLEKLDRDFPGFFPEHLRVTARDCTHGKPHPEPYLMAMRKAGVEPHEAVVVENAPIGVTSGSRSGAFTIGVTTGPIPAERMEEAGADVVFASMPRCAAALPALLSKN